MPGFLSRSRNKYSCLDVDGQLKCVSQMEDIVIAPDHFFACRWSGP